MAMKGFKFKLLPVLKYREFTEERAKQNLASLKRNLAENRRRQQELQKTRDYYKNILDQMKAKSFNIREIAEYQAYLERVDLWIEKREKEQGEIESQIRIAIQGLGKASQEKKIIENLKDKAFSLYKGEIEKIENNFLDEIGVLQSARLARETAV